MGADTGSTRKLVAIELLKASLLSEEADLFRAMVSGPEDQIVDALAGLIITTYTLSLRLGVNAPRLEERAIQRIEHALKTEGDAKDWHRDLEHLRHYLVVRDSVPWHKE